MSSEKRKWIRFVVSWLILGATILYWFTQNPEDLIWDVAVLSIVIAAGFTAFGEDRFAEAVGAARDIFQPSEESPESQPSDDEERPEGQPPDRTQ